MDRKGSQATSPFLYVEITSAEQDLGIPHLPVPSGGKEVNFLGQLWSKAHRG